MAFTTHLSVLDGIRQDKEEAWRRFCALYAPLVRLCGRDCGVPEDLLADLTQEVLLTLARGHGAGYDDKRGHFRCFLRGIIRNKAHELLRRDRDAATVPLTEDLPVPAEGGLAADFDREWAEQVSRIVCARLREELPPVHFQVFELLHRHGWRAGQVAEFLHLPKPTVYSIDRRTQEKIRRFRRELGGL